MQVNGYFSRYGIQGTLEIISFRIAFFPGDVTGEAETEEEKMNIARADSPNTPISKLRLWQRRSFMIF